MRPSTGRPRVPCAGPPGGATARWLLAVGNGGLVQTWDGRELGMLEGGTKQNLRGAAWSPDGTTALLVGNRGAVLRVEGETMRELPQRRRPRTCDASPGTRTARGP